MAYRISGNLGYGDGAQGNVTAGAAQVINNYANVYDITSNSIKIRDATGDGYGSFNTVGQEIMIHVAAVKKTSLNVCNKRGYWILCKIKSVDLSSGIILLSKDVSAAIKGFSIDDLYVQAITIPHFKTLTLNKNKSITCPQFNTSTGVGGVVVFKCSEELKFNGGVIDVGNKGLPSGDMWNYGKVKEENAGGDFGLTHDWEGFHNYRATRHLTINYPDGAVFFAAKKMTCHKDSTIGSKLVANEDVRGRVMASDGSQFGGACIFIVAETIEDWQKNMINRINVNAEGTGRGISRAYIASETVLPTCALFAYDRIANSNRMQEVFNITTWGDGSKGDGKNVTTQLNSYAHLKSISSNGKKFAFDTVDENGIAQLEVGALVMIHSTQKNAKTLALAGKFMVTKITKRDTTTITVEDAFDTAVYGHPKTYNVQMIAIPQYQNFTMSNSKCNNAALKYDASKGIGGIMAIAVKDTCNLSDGGYLAVKEKGGAYPYGEKGLEYIGNASMAERLPIGEGHGSIFILAKNLIMSTSTRLGWKPTRSQSGVAESGGNYFGGINRAVESYNTHENARSYPYQINAAGHDILDSSNGINYTVAATDIQKMQGTVGGLEKIGRSVTDDDHKGGLGSNSSDGACQGAHLLIIADKITGFNLNALCTGGDGGRIFSYESPGQAYVRTGEPGGCGYGGSGGSVKTTTYKGATNQFRGGNGGVVGGGGGCENTKGEWASGGGSSGFCFVYCNKHSSANWSGITLD